MDKRGICLGGTFVGFILDSGHTGGVMFVFVEIQMYLDRGESCISSCLQDSCIN